VVQERGGAVAASKGSGAHGAGGKGGRRARVVILNGILRFKVELVLEPGTATGLDGEPQELRYLRGGRRILCPLVELEYALCASCGDDEPLGRRAA